MFTCRGVWVQDVDQTYPAGAVRRAGATQRRGSGGARAEDRLARRHGAPGTNPLEFIQRLAALVPRLRLPLIGFQGMRPANAELRARVVPQAPPAQPAEAAEGEAAASRPSRNGLCSSRPSRAVASNHHRPGPCRAEPAHRTGLSVTGPAAVRSPCPRVACPRRRTACPSACPPAPPAPIPRRRGRRCSRGPAAPPPRPAASRSRPSATR